MIDNRGNDYNRTVLGHAMRAKVPVMEYLRMITGFKKNPLISFQNQCISEGFVLFDNRRLHILKDLLRSVNEGMPMPISYLLVDNERRAVFSGSSQTKEYSGIDARDLSDVLEGWHVKDLDYFACRCPAHMGKTTTSMTVRRDTGAWTCHMGCDNGDIYKALKALVPEQKEE